MENLKNKENVYEVHEFDNETGIGVIINGIHYNDELFKKLIDIREQRKQVNLVFDNNGYTINRVATIDGVQLVEYGGRYSIRIYAHYIVNNSLYTIRIQNCVQATIE